MSNKDVSISFQAQREAACMVLGYAIDTDNEELTQILCDTFDISENDATWLVTPP